MSINFDDPNTWGEDFTTRDALAMGVFAVSTLAHPGASTVAQMEALDFFTPQTIDGLVSLREDPRPIWTLTVDTDTIVTTVHTTEQSVYDALVLNFAPEFSGDVFTPAGREALIEELTERQGVVLYIEEHALPCL